jgi:hypothetical protein
MSLPFELSACRFMSHPLLYPLSFEAIGLGRSSVLYVLYFAWARWDALDVDVPEISTTPSSVLPRNRTSHSGYSISRAGDSTTCINSAVEALISGVLELERCWCTAWGYRGAPAPCRGGAKRRGGATCRFLEPRKATARRACVSGGCL